MTDKQYAPYDAKILFCIMSTYTIRANDFKNMQRIIHKNSEHWLTNLLTISNFKGVRIMVHTDRKLYSNKNK